MAVTFVNTKTNFQGIGFHVIKIRGSFDRDSHTGKRESWLCHQMEAFSALLALCVGNSPVTVEFPSQKPVTRNFDVFSGLCLQKQLSKQPKRRWFLRRHPDHYDVTVMSLGSLIHSMLNPNYMGPVFWISCGSNIYSHTTYGSMTEVLFCAWYGQVSFKVF